MTGGPAAEAGVAAHVVVAVEPGIGLTERFDLTGHDGHHLQRVRRLRVGEHVTLADGFGGWRRYAVAAAGRGMLELDALGPLAHEPEIGPAVAVAAAVSKGTKLETIAAHLTELGVAEVAPLLTERSAARLDADDAARLHERLCAVVLQAAGQSRRAWLPIVRPLGTIADLAARPGLVVAAIDGEPASAFVVGGAGATIVTGPEGGLSPAERAQLTAMGARSLRLGRFVLRAETAPLAAAAILISGQVV